MTTTAPPIDHGSRRGYDQGCRQRCCRDARRVYERARRRAHLYGRPPLVDVTAARRHVGDLITAGFPAKRIAAAAAVPGTTVWRLMATPPLLDRLRRDTAEALLAVTPDRLAPTGAVRVSAVGTRRRLQGLVALGWSQRRIAARLGIPANNLPRWLRGDALVSAAVAEQVRVLFDELCWSLPPTGTPAEKRAASRAKRIAAQYGWAPPLAWDDDSIDDPAAIPQVGERHRSNAVVDPSEVEWLRSFGTSDELIADRLGVRLATLQGVMRRAVA